MFVGSLAAGWWLGRRGVLTEARARQLIRFIVRALTPIILWLSFWRLNLTDIRPFLLPLIGMVVAVASLLPAWGYCRLARFTRPQTGSFLTCACFSNLGFLGAFIAFALYGEQGYGLSMLYLVFFSPCFYLLGFSLAKRFGQHPGGASSSETFAEQLRLYPFLGLLLGVGCSVAKAPRPTWCEGINYVLIPIDTALYLMAIGSHLRVALPRRWGNAYLAMGAIKCWYSPLVGWALVWLWHLEGLPRFIVLLQTSMPTAVSALMLPILFGLDRELSSALWVSSTVLAIPWLLLYLPLIR